MSSFDLAIPVVLKHEGGFADNPADPGGATNFGISIRYLRSIGEVIDIDGDGDMDAADMRLLPQGTAIELYRDIWEQNRYAQIGDQDLATKVFDLTVNAGARQSHKLLQRALRACGVTLTEDGILGMVTLAAVNKVPGFPQIVGLRSEAAGFYRSLTVQKPALAVFLPNWIRRAYS